MTFTDIEAIRKNCRGDQNPIIPDVLVSDESLVRFLLLIQQHLVGWAKHVVTSSCKQSHVNLSLASCSYVGQVQMMPWHTAAICLVLEPVKSSRLPRVPAWHPRAVLKFSSLHQCACEHPTIWTSMGDGLLDEILELKKLSLPIIHQSLVSLSLLGCSVASAICANITAQLVIGLHCS